MDEELLQLSCPGKIFILGEYSVMVGGPSIIATAGPEFSVQARRGTDGDVRSPFAPGSPAGLLISRFTSKLRGIEFDWQDPYATPIGVGSSSAQFVLVAQAIHMLTGRGKLSGEQMLRLYWDVVGNSQGSRPSGGDVVAQYVGGVNIFRNEPFECSALNEWAGEPSASFILAFSGRKARTHEHLQRLHERGYPSGFEAVFEKINSVTSRGIDAWKRQDAQTFGNLMNEFQDVMNASGIADQEYASAITTMRTLPGVYGCKGSGAQAGDCALLLVSTGKLAAVEGELSKMGWQPFRMRWSTRRS